MHAVTSVRSSF